MNALEQKIAEYGLSNKCNHGDMNGPCNWNKCMECDRHTSTIEAVKEIAFRFAEWCDSNEWILVKDNIWFNEVDMVPNPPKIEYTTDELFNLFIEETYGK